MVYTIINFFGVNMKKITALLLCLMMCLSVLTGCSLIERNDKNYYESTVATITYADGTKENITKRELLTAYNSYGYNYVDNYGYTKEQAIKTTLDSIVNNRLTMLAVENYYEENPTEGEMLNGNERSYIWDQTYEALYSNLLSNLEGVVEGEETDDAEAESSLYSPYKPTIYLDEDLNLRLTTPATTIRETYNGLRDGVYYDYELEEAGVRTYRELMYNKLYPNEQNLDAQSFKAWKNAFNKYVSIVKSNYSYLDFKDDKECFLFEMDRVYKIIRDQYVVEKYSVIFNEQNHQDADLSSITASDVLKYYSSKVREDYTTYYIQNDKSSFESSILSSVGDVDYILEGNSYFFVAPIKIEISETNQELLKEKQALRDAGSITLGEYEEFERSIYSTASVTVRDKQTGKETSQTISASNLLTKIQNELDGLSIEDKVEKYRDFLYLYNCDDSLKGADYNTVFGIDGSNNVLTSDDYSNDNIKEAIKTLYNQGNAQVGDLSDLVKVDDGYYIFFFAGNISNLFYVGDNFDISKDIQSIKILASTKLNVFSNKTLLDKIYSEMSNDNFSIFESLNMNNLWTNYTSKVEYIENNIKDLY